MSFQAPRWGGMTKAYATHKAGGRRGKLGNRESGTPEREARSATERGVSRGPSPWTRSLGTFSGARESTSPAGARTGKSHRACRNPPAEENGSRATPWGNLGVAPLSRPLVPFGRRRKELALPGENGTRLRRISPRLQNFRLTTRPNFHIILLLTPYSWPLSILDEAGCLGGREI